MPTRSADACDGAPARALLAAAATSGLDGRDLRYPKRCQPSSGCAKVNFSGGGGETAFRFVCPYGGYHRWRKRLGVERMSD